MVNIVIFHSLYERQNRRERVFRQRTNQSLYLSILELISHRKLPRQAIEDLIDLIKLDIEHQTFQSHAFDATTCFLILYVTKIKVSSAILNRFCKFCAYNRRRYQLSVYKTIDPLVLKEKSVLEIDMLTYFPYQLFVYIYRDGHRG